MKKIFLVLLAFVLMLNSSFVVLADEETAENVEVPYLNEFEVTADGVLTAYYGESFVSIPSEVNGIEIKKIGERAFFDLGIQDVILGAGIEEIGKSAFEGCNVESVYFPTSVKKIGDSAFGNCSELNYVVFDSADVELGEKAFYGTGFIEFYIYCTEDEEKVRSAIKEAKGDDNFDVMKMHTSLLENPDKKDILGVNLVYCEGCGYEGSAYLDDIALPFTDVPEESWFYPYVLFSYSFGIINGKSETEFCPDGNMTCAEAAKIAASIHAFQTTGEAIEASGEKWYDAYVNYCYEHGIIEKSVEFDWDAPITRGETAYFFSRCDVYTYHINEVPITDIPDVDSKTPFAMEILDLYNKGVAVGEPDYSFKPEANVKRSEAAAFVTRILGWELRTELPKG